jgi:hypothetical protein
VTRVLWNVPLGAYTDRTLAEIRALRTHGEKRIRAILDVFRSVHAVAAGMGAAGAGGMSGMSSAAGGMPGM